MRHNPSENHSWPSCHKHPPKEPNTNKLLSAAMTTLLQLVSGCHGAGMQAMPSSQVSGEQTWKAGSKICCSSTNWGDNFMENLALFGFQLSFQIRAFFQQQKIDFQF